ncbi:hypothetical protein [Mesorhizobium huakuii]|uniref:Uncharacterized protein n=1 Tax=Mesorhizobium huakuii TaxID=28104 RepID=A0A7G6T1C3_9HYPH|nr:hypothetical protein [Mesorhizobium huakuii]QND60555.1 hypothetical protein HB778_31450 [Mesorhizobium huakuii]
MRRRSFAIVDIRRDSKSEPLSVYATANNAANRPVDEEHAQGANHPRWI